jgi:hypothetical protein
MSRPIVIVVGGFAGAYLARYLERGLPHGWEIIELSPRATGRVLRAHYEPGDYVFRQGDFADKFYVIEKGTAAVYLTGRPQPVLTLRPGDNFGEGTPAGSHRPRRLGARRGTARRAGGPAPGVRGPHHAPALPADRPAEPGRSAAVS